MCLSSSSYGAVPGSSSSHTNPPASLPRHTPLHVVHHPSSSFFCRQTLRRWLVESHCSTPIGPLPIATASFSSSSHPLHSRHLTLPADSLAICATLVSSRSFHFPSTGRLCGLHASHFHPDRISCQPNIRQHLSDHLHLVPPALPPSPSPSQNAWLAPSASTCLEPRHFYVSQLGPRLPPLWPPSTTTQHLLLLCLLAFARRPKPAPTAFRAASFAHAPRSSRLASSS